jgi:hypothetical protein
MLAPHVNKGQSFSLVDLSSDGRGRRLLDVRGGVFAEDSRRSTSRCAAFATRHEYGVDDVDHGDPAVVAGLGSPLAGGCFRRCPGIRVQALSVVQEPLRSLELPGIRKKLG